MLLGKDAFGGLIRAASLAGTLIALALAAGASAQVVESSTILNTYSYRVGGLQGSDNDAPDNVSLFLSDTAGGYESDMGLQLTSSLNNGSFFFLHNGYCVGDCQVTITTDITFTLTNTGTDAVDLRFDSLITPGHLAGANLSGTSSAQKGNYLFEVSQDGTSLYSSDGVNSTRPSYPIVETSDGVPFNGETSNDNSPAWNVLDWSATNLSVNLTTLGAGESTTVVYSSRIDVVTTNTTCLDTTSCLGYQVAFGDPRSRGDPTVSTGRYASSSEAESDTTFPAVGAAYDPYTVSYAFVDVNTSLPDPQPTYPPFDYDIPYGQNSAIPEPSTWALMLLGFGAIGGVARRRRKDLFATG